MGCFHCPLPSYQYTVPIMLRLSLLVLLCLAISCSLALDELNPESAGSVLATLPREKRCVSYYGRCETDSQCCNTNTIVTKSCYKLSPWSKKRCHVHIGKK